MMKTIEQIFEELASKAGSRLQLGNMIEAHALLGNPANQFDSIHVAGTNGKGTVVTKIAHTLTSLGFKTGLYTSPHLHTFRERIRIDGEMIPEDEVMEGLNKILEVSKVVTFFEIMTLLAFYYFAKHEVDYALIETGLGGTLDATNVIYPLVSVITNISNDHIEILGPTLDDIARNKAGIIKPGAAVVLGARACRRPVLQKVVEMQSPLYLVRAIENTIEENSAIAARVIKILLPHTDMEVSPDRPSCRFEVHDYEGTTAIFDVAHNEDGLTRLFKEVKERYPRKKIYTLFGLSRSKDLAAICPMLEKESTCLFHLNVEHPRLATLEQIEKHCHHLSSQSLESFIQEAKEAKAILLITGSFFIMSFAKEQLGFLIHSDFLLLHD